MRIALAAVFLSLLAFSAAAQDASARARAQSEAQAPARDPARSQAQAPKGWLLAVGGGGTTDVMVTRALELAGGPKVRMLIVPQASGAEDAGTKSLEFWREKGALDVQILDLKDRTKALAAIGVAGFLWMPGGDQNRLMTALREADVIEAIRARYRDGALVGGTSAGAAVLSATMIVGGDRADLTNVKSGGTEMEAGIGLWPDAIVDQHFLKRQRFNRLLSGVLDHPELVGLGIDERTGVILHPDGACEVVGEGSVLVIDARRANCRPAAKAELQSADAMTLAIHRGGERFTLVTSEKR